MTVHIVVLEDENTHTQCHAFSTEEKASAFSAQQGRIGLWMEIDQYEVEVDAL
jgi:hypothetical protein